MIEDKKIENLFRDNQHKLDEMPSPMAWDRLEVRLEKRELTHRKRFVWRRLAIAAAVIIAVSMIGLWTYIDPLSSTMNQTAEIFPKKGELLASEIISSDAPSPARPLLMSHREKVQYLTEASKTRMNTRPALALKENKSTEKATNVPPTKPKPQTTKPQPQADVAPITTTDMTVEADFAPIEIEKNMEEAATAKVVIAEEVIELPTKAYKELDEAADGHGAIAIGTTTSATTPTTTQPTTISGYTFYDNVDDTPQDYSDDVEEEVEEVVVLEGLEAERDKQISKARRSADKARAAKDVRSESMPAMDVAEPELDRFDWLLGKWTDEDDNSFEEWRRISPNILEGKGYFVVDVDTTFTQSMKIIQANAQVFFMVNGQMVEGEFELEKYDDRTATFKNKQEAREQITLEKDDGNAYSVTIEKSKKMTAKERRKKKRTFKRVNE